MPWRAERGENGKNLIIQIEAITVALFSPRVKSSLAGESLKGLPLVAVVYQNEFFFERGRQGREFLNPGMDAAGEQLAVVENKFGVKLGVKFFQ